MRRFLFIAFLGLGVVCAQANESRAAPDAWPRALELMRDGQSEAALPLLEDLVSAHPNNKDYRFELALALFRTGRHFRARWQLEQVRGAGLTSTERRLVENFLSQIAANTLWSGALSFAFRSESNATRQTSDQTINSDGLDFVLAPDARGKPGSSVIVNARIGYAPHFSEQWTGRFSLSANLRNNDDRRLRDFQLTGQAGLQYRINQRSLIAGGMLHGVRWVAEERYSDSTGVWMEYSQLAGDRGRLDFSLELRNIHSLTALPDSRRALLWGSYSHAFKTNARLALSGYLEKSDDGLANLTGHRAGVAVKGLYAWSGGLMTSLEVAYHTDRRRGPEPVFGVTRNDDKKSLELSVYHRDFRIGSFAPTLIIGAEANRSNIPLARYNNEYVSMGLTRNF